MANNNLMVGLEIGTSKICVVVGESRPDGTLKILGVGQAPSRGVRKGEIVDFETAMKCVHEAVVDAEQKSDVMIKSVYVAVAGSHLHSFNNRGCVALPDERDEIVVIEAGRGAERGHHAELLARDSEVGVIWPNNRDVDDLVPYLDRLAVIALVFPTFRDGRAYSQARLLKERYDYRGELRATGHLVHAIRTNGALADPLVVGDDVHCAASCISAAVSITARTILS